MSKVIVNTHTLSSFTSLTILYCNTKGTHSTSLRSKRKQKNAHARHQPKPNRQIRLPASTKGKLSSAISKQISVDLYFLIIVKSLFLFE